MRVMMKALRGWKVPASKFTVTNSMEPAKMKMLMARM